MTGLGGHAHPLQLPLKGFLSFAFTLLLLCEALRLLFQPAAVIAFKRNALTPVEFKNPTGHLIQEIAVVGNGDDRAFVALQVLFEPVDAFRVEVVGRLVEQKHIRFLKQ